MGDKKISELTQLASANATTDVLPIVDGSLNQTDKITIAKFPMSASAIARSYPYTRDFISNIERTRDVTSITASEFLSNSNLTSIYIGSHVTSIGNYAFKSCTSLTSVTITNNVTSIGNYAFFSCSSLTSITIPNSVTSIALNTFENCSSLTSITLTEGLTSIGSSAFRGCTDLTSITIPGSVTSIGTLVFQNCINLATITSLATSAPTLGLNAFDNITATTITVPKNSTTSYQTAGNGTTYGGLTIVEV